MPLTFNKTIPKDVKFYSFDAIILRIIDRPDDYYSYDNFVQEVIKSNNKNKVSQTFLEQFKIFSVFDLHTCANIDSLKESAATTIIEENFDNTDDSDIDKKIQDAKKNELLEPRNIIEKFPEQIFPIKIVKYGKVYYISSLDELKPLPPNQKEQLGQLVRSLLPVDSIINLLA